MKTKTKWKQVRPGFDVDVEFHEEANAYLVSLPHPQRAR
jgi:hypothetical protein